MSPQAADFLSRLQSRAGRAARVVFADYFALFALTAPGLTGDSFRLALADTCDELAASGDIALPRSKNLYDRGGGAALPAWIELRRPGTQAEVLPVDPETFPWAPELRFACDVRDRSSLETLLRVHRFLTNEGGRQRPIVPAKERSVELFGDEKRLERMQRGSLFSPGRLTFDMLRCHTLAPALIHEPGPASPLARPFLVIENFSTYCSFARWNQEHGCYAAVVYGSGDSFESAVAGLNTLPVENWNHEAFYFGDIDINGLLIPTEASLALTPPDCLKPHAGCYSMLIKQAHAAAHLPQKAAMKTPAACRQWLGEALAPSVEALLHSGRRAPQELIGLELLSTNGREFAVPTVD